MGACRCGLTCWMAVLGIARRTRPNVQPSATMSAWLASCLWRTLSSLGDRKMPTAENQLTWLRLNLGYIGPMMLQDQHRQTLRALVTAGQTWQVLPYVAQREAAQPPAERTVYRGLGHTVEVTDPAEPTRHWSVRHLYVHSSALASRETARRHNEMEAIEAELQRLQGLVNKYDYKTPEIITRRAQSKAFKKRQAQKYFTIEVVHHADRPAAPLELRYDVDHTQVQRDADLDGVYLLVAGGKAATLSDAESVTEWKGQYKVEHCFRLVNQLFLVAPVFLKTPQRIAALVFLIGRVPLACGSFGNLRNRVKYPHFSTSTRGFCHGLPSLFLPVGAGRSGVAVRHAPVGVAKRPRRRGPDGTGTHTPTAQAPPCTHTLCGPHHQAALR